MSLSGGLKLTDLNDFITPSQACIKPISVPKTDSMVYIYIYIFFFFFFFFLKKKIYKKIYFELDSYKIINIYQLN